MCVIPRNLICKCPCGIAVIQGSDAYPQIHGTVSFFAAKSGSVVFTELFHLPEQQGFFAMHIHKGTSCTGSKQDPFADASTHLNLTNAEHPFHTGDLPALLNNNGYAWSAVYTNRFSPMQVQGHVVILHAKPDDYHTQPSGNSGEKIACGVIRSASGTR